MRSAIILGVYRGSKDSLSHLSEIYASSSLSAKDMRNEYKQQLLDANPKGSYTYGHRTRAHFGKDQLSEAVLFLKKYPGQVFVIQRFDPITDMTITETPIIDDNGKIIRTRIEATHDPCLTHDIYFVSGGKLHSFHIARAHNIVNAYPENIFGLHDAYDETVASELGIGLGDMFMLSSRGNMLLLTEEQKAKKLIAEPCKPMVEVDNSMGPYDLRHSFPSQGVGMFSTPLEKMTERVKHPCLEILENYNGVNLIEKAANYLLKKGNGHNNPILTCFDPRTVHLINPKNRLIFFQCNQRGGKLQSTAVFADGKNSTLSSDVQLCNYISTKYSKILDIPLGTLTLFYTPMRT